MENSSQRVRLNSLASPVMADPATVQGVINELFSYYGSSTEIENVLWDMFQGSITNPVCPTDALQNGEQSFVYKMLLKTIRGLEKFKDTGMVDLPEN